MAADSADKIHFYEIATNQASDQIIRRILKELLRWYTLLQFFEPVEHDVDLGV